MELFNPKLKKNFIYQEGTKKASKKPAPKKNSCPFTAVKHREIPCNYFYSAVKHREIPYGYFYRVIKQGIFPLTIFIAQQSIGKFPVTIFMLCNMK